MQSDSNTFESYDETKYVKSHGGPVKAPTKSIFWLFEAFSYKSDSDYKYYLISKEIVNYTNEEEDNSKIIDKFLEIRIFKTKKTNINVLDKENNFRNFIEMYEFEEIGKYEKDEDRDKFKEWLKHDDRYKKCPCEFELDGWNDDCCIDHLYEYEDRDGYWPIWDEYLDSVSYNVHTDDPEYDMIEYIESSGNEIFNGEKLVVNNDIAIRIYLTYKLRKSRLEYQELVM